MRRIVMYPHGGSGNHGCEAIVRTTTNLLAKEKIFLFSENPEEDHLYLGETDYDIRKPTSQTNRLSLKYMNAFIKRKFGHEEAYDELYFDPILSSLNKDTVLLSIGGDNYCYGDNDYIYLVNRCARVKGAKTVLWGCSIEPNHITEHMLSDLKSYDLIVARESISYKVLKDINPATILCPDPAFILEQERGEYSDGLNRGEYIGINISPMIQSHEKRNGLTIKNYEKLIDYIIADTKDNVALIPHVVWAHNDDRKPLNELYERYRETGRVFLVSDQNCKKLKDIISGCKRFVGARTHSTIAAYSTQVPTLVVGYSNKAVGIATDIFGTDQNYVLPVQSLSTERDLLDAYIWLENNDRKIRERYCHVMPKYISNTYKLSSVLNDFIGAS